MTAYAAVIKHCRECMNNKVGEVAKCTATECYWYDWRFKKPKGSTIKAIKKYCLNECCGVEDRGKYKRVEECDPLLPCALWPFRLGKNPKKRKLSPEHKKAVLDRLAQGRKMRSKVINSRRKGTSGVLPVKVV